LLKLKTNLAAYCQTSSIQQLFFLTLFEAWVARGVHLCLHLSSKLLSSQRNSYVACSEIITLFEASVARGVHLCFGSRPKSLGTADLAIVA